MEQIEIRDTIAAIATPKGSGGIAIVRVSGPNAFRIVNDAWKGTDLLNAKSHSVHLGNYTDLSGNILDQGLVTLFRNPSSFTGEDVVEIGLHGSPWIQREVLSDLIKRGVRIAEPGEFTQRAFLNGKVDLAQAEGIADLIAASSKAAHDLALSQTKGTFSKEFNELRDKLIEFASLLELELDFSEEDVEFADRRSLVSLCENILARVNKLTDSYSKGAVLKDGVPVVIAGIPNAGKSSLLNLLLNDDKAIVTDIPGTTRDIIEDITEIGGILFRFIDTAGLRETNDIVEEIGVNRAKSQMQKAYIVIWVLDPTSDLPSQLQSLKNFKEGNPEVNIIVLKNKTDIDSSPIQSIEKASIRGKNDICNSIQPIEFSTVKSIGYDQLISRLLEIVSEGINTESDIIISNARHFQALSKASEALQRALTGLNPSSHEGSEAMPLDIIAQDIREAISHLGLITGSITSTDLLHSIFSRFCIGK